MKKLIILVFLLALCACAKKAPLPTGESMPGEYWQKMLALKQVEGPWRMQLSLRFGQEGDTRRVTGLMWGNSADKLRLDVMAGVGAVIAQIFEDKSSFLVYAQQTGKAYYHEGPDKPLFKVGVPVPFDLTQLASLLNGDYGMVFGKSPANARPLENGGASCTLAQAPGGTLKIDGEGLPVEWNEGGNGWRMQIVHAEEGLKLPKRLNLERPNGQKAIVLVRERQTDLPPFTQEQLELTLPKGTPLLPLSEYKPS